MIELLTDYSFLTVMVGTVLLASACGMIGTITVLTKQSLIGDTIGHATFPGIVVAFMIFQTRQPLLLMAGAMVFGYFSSWLITLLARDHRQSKVNVMALIASAFFGLGMVLKQYIQGHEQFNNASQAGLQSYLFGQAAFIQQEDLWLIGTVAIVCIAFVIGCYRPLCLYLFQPPYARVIGIQTERMHRIIRLLMIALIAVGLKVVGVILMSSFLIAPAVFGMMGARSYKSMLLLSVVSASFAAFCGTFLSSMYSGVSTGPAIIVVMSLLVFSMLIWQGWRARKKQVDRKEGVHG